MDGSIHTEIDHQFHDNPIYGLKLVQPDPERELWISELRLDIDHILRWIRHGENGFRFEISKAELCFHQVSDLHLSFAFPGTTLHALPIDRLERSDQPVVERGENHVEYRWKLFMNDLPKSVITFQSSGYSLESLSNPVMCEEQEIPARIRTKL